MYSGIFSCYNIRVQNRSCITNSNINLAPIISNVFNLWASVNRRVFQNANLIQHSFNPSGYYKVITRQA